MSEEERKPKSPAEILEDAVRGKAAALKDNNVFEAHQGLRNVIGSTPGGNVRLFAKYQEKEAISRKALVEETLREISDVKRSVENGDLKEGHETIQHMLDRLRKKDAEYERKQAGLKLGPGNNLSPDEIATGFQILETLSCKGMLDSIFAAVERVGQAMEGGDLNEARTVIDGLVKDLNEQVSRHEQAIQAAREAHER